MRGKICDGSGTPYHGVGPSSGNAGWVGGSGGWPCSTGRRVGVGVGCGVARSFGKKNVKRSNRTARVHGVAVTQLHFGRSHARGSFCPRQLYDFDL